MESSVQSAPAAGSTERRGPLDSVLNLFSDVRGGEGLTALLLLLNVFLLLASYYLIKTVREPWILAAEGGGAEVKSYASAGIAALLIVLVPIYSALASRVSRVKLINGVTLFFIACLVAFFLWGKAVGMPGAEVDEAAVAGAGADQLACGIAFFVWVGIFNLMIIAQFWALANDIYTVEQGKRLFAIIAVGASLGAIAGAKGAELLAERIDLYVVLGIAAAILAVCMVLTNIVHQREKRRGVARAGAASAAASADPGRTVPAEGEGGGDADAVIKGRSGFALVFADKYLLLIALLMLILNLVNTTGEYILGETLTNIAKERVAAGQMAEGDIGSWIGSFYGNFFFWVNTVSALVQAFLVSRIIKWIGIRGALLVLPCGGFGCLRDPRGRPGAGVHPRGEDRRELARLLAQQHHPADPVPAHLARGQVQGQAGGGHVLRPGRRRAVGGARLRGDDLAGVRAAAVRHGERGARAGLARHRLHDRADVQGAGEDGLGLSGGARGARLLYPF